MSLVGNLEDLSLGDILQIVSLSRKSGILSLKNRGREGRILFLHGQVIRATSSVYRENLGDLLLRRALVDVDTLKKALHLQRTQPRPQRIGQILAQHFGIDSKTIEAVVREQVEKIVYSFFGWTEGSFSFELEEPADLADTSLNPLQFMLEQGISPQWLALQGSRRADDGGEPEALSGSAPSPACGGPARGLPEDRGETVPSPEPLCPKEGDQKLFDLGAELLAELGEGAGRGGAVESSGNPGLHLLKGMLQELNNSSLGGGIILLVLRFASEFVNRAVIFVLREDEIVGLGQFGIELPLGSADERVRSIRLPATEPSLFSRALQERAPVKISPGESRLDRYFFEQLGGCRPAEAFLGPILSEGKIVAVLYGDNLPDSSKPVGDTEPLEIFLSQAGLAMEKALLERRLGGRMQYEKGERACAKRF